MSEDENTPDSIPSNMVIIIRPALKKACCEGDPCRAAIFNQLLYALAWKRKQGRDYWYGSGEHICTFLLDNSWGVTKVRQEVEALVKQGFLGRRNNPRFRWDRTWHYIFGEGQGKRFRDACDKARICVTHHMGFTPDVMALLKEFDAINTCKCAPVEDIQPIPKTRDQRKPASKTTNTRITELRAMPYSDYLKSPEWAAKRMKALRFASFKCQMCNAGGSLNVHHRTYERLGAELLGDLITLCSDCHSIFHNNQELAE